MLVKRHLTEEEEEHLVEFLDGIGIAYNPGAVVKCWGNAVIGPRTSGADGYVEAIGSAQSVAIERGGNERRDNSYVHYIQRVKPIGDDHENDPDDSNADDDGYRDMGFVGKALFFMSYDCAANSIGTPDPDIPSTILLAYVLNAKMTFIKDARLVYRLDWGLRHWVHLIDVQELLGVIRTRETDFFVRRTTCFWQREKMGYEREELNDDFLAMANDRAEAATRARRARRARDSISVSPERA